MEYLKKLKIWFKINSLRRKVEDRRRWYIWMVGYCVPGASEYALAKRDAANLAYTEALTELDSVPIR